MKNLPKKILLCCTLALALFITGCGKENVQLDLKELAPKLDELLGKEFARFDAADILEQEMSGLEDVYDYDFEEKLGLNPENIEEYRIAINNDKTMMYFIVLPKDGKKNTVKEEIEQYIDSLPETVKSKMSYDEVQGYLLYVVADNSKDLLTRAKEARSKVFSNLTEIDSETLSQRYGIEESMLEEYVIKNPTLVVNSNAYAIIKPKDGQKDAVKKKMDEYMTKLEEQWKTYLPDQYDLVKGRKVEEYGDYLIYIISSDNELVWNTIKDNNKA